LGEDVALGDIVSDYLFSTANLTPFYARKGVDDEGPKIAAFLAAEGLTFDKIIRDTLASLDIVETLRGAGVSEQDLAAV
jgi:hypothetical protein